MNIVSSVSANPGLAPILPPPLPKPAAPTPGVDGASKPFAAMFDNAIDGLEAKQAAAADVTRSVLMGDNPNLHQGVIAMQEASLSFSLMVEVRNKVVEAYQHLMRMPV